MLSLKHCITKEIDNMENIIQTAEQHKVQISHETKGERVSVTIRTHKWVGCFIEDIEAEVIEHIKLVA